MGKLNQGDSEKVAFSAQTVIPAQAGISQLV
jgi:hypothetical protein